MRFINTVEIDGNICSIEIEYRMTVAYAPTGYKLTYYADKPTRFYEMGPVVADTGHYTAVIDAIMHCYVNGELVKDIEYPMSEF